MTLDRPFILKELITIVACFANKKQQEQAWLWGQGHWACDFEETCCLLEDMTIIIFNDNHKLYGITDAQYYMLQKFTEAISDFPENNPHEFLNSPEWQRIRKMAKDITDSFNYK